MIYFDKNFTFNGVPSIFKDLFDEVLSLSNHKIVFLTIHEFENIDKKIFYKNANDHNCDFVIIYHFSGSCKVPIIEDLPIKTIYLYYSFEVYKNLRDNIYYFPNWLFSTTFLSNPYKLMQTSEYLFSCANRNFNNGRKGKIFNYQLLKKQSYFDKILWTKYQSTEDFEFNANPNKNEDPEFFQELENFLKEYVTWPKWNSKELELNIAMGNTTLDVYKKSLFHIVAESEISAELLSEKTWKVLLVGQIPIMCGPRGSIAHLRDLGFDVFDDIVDHSYDEIFDWKERIKEMHNSLSKIALLDHNILIKDTLARREKNINRMSINLINHIMTPIINCLTQDKK